MNPRMRSKPEQSFGLESGVELQETGQRPSLDETLSGLSTGWARGFLLRSCATSSAPQLRRSVFDDLAVLGLTWINSRSQNVAQVHLSGQVHQGEKVLGVWANASAPPPEGERVGPDAPGQLSPRQTGRLLEPLQALGESVKVGADCPPVARALAGHGSVPPQGHLGALSHKYFESARDPGRQT